MEALSFIGDVGFPIASAIGAGFFIFTTLKFILNSVTVQVGTLNGMVKSLDNRVLTMNNELVKIDALMSYALGVKPNTDRIAANEGKADARRD